LVLTKVFHLAFCASLSKELSSLFSPSLARFTSRSLGYLHLD